MNATKTPKLCNKLQTRNLILKKIIHYVYGSLARTSKNEPKMWGNPKSRSQEEYYCMCKRNNPHMETDEDTLKSIKLVNFSQTYPLFLISVL